MVDVGDKDVSTRGGGRRVRDPHVARGRAALVAGTPKGDPLEAAKVAGLMAAKRTPDLLPVLPSDRAHRRGLVLEPDPEAGAIRVEATVRANDRTGVEMEALTAAAVSALCLYDTAKAFDRAAEIGGLHLLAKSGGKSGDYRRQTDSVAKIAATEVSSRDEKSTNLHLRHQMLGASVQFQPRCSGRTGARPRGGLVLSWILAGRFWSSSGLRSSFPPDVARPPRASRSSKKR